MPLMCSECPIHLSSLLELRLTHSLQFSTCSYLSEGDRHDAPSELYARCNCRMQFADKTTLGQSAVLGLL